MSKSKHAPGPWKTTTNSGPEGGILWVRDRDDRILCEVIMDFAESDDELKSNANLMAAAPELVRALGGLKNAAKGLGMDEPAIRELIGNTNWHVIQHWIGEAEAALAEARGEPS